MKVIRLDRPVEPYFPGITFRRNTLLECGDVRIVVSTIGKFETLPEIRGVYKHPYLPLGASRFYETMIWHARLDGGYWDSDISRRIVYGGPWQINRVDKTSDDDAAQMHELAIAEITKQLLAGERFGEPIRN